MSVEARAGGCQTSHCLKFWERRSPPPGGGAPFRGNLHEQACRVFREAVALSVAGAADRHHGGLFLLALLAGLLATGYIHYEADALIDREQMPTDLDTVVGIVIIVLSIVGAYKVFGAILPIMALLGIAYAFLGPYFPGELFHAGVDFTRLVAMLTTDLSGIYGTLLYISATYMAVFLELGSFI